MSSNTVRNRRRESDSWRGSIVDKQDPPGANASTRVSIFDRETGGKGGGGGLGVTRSLRQNFERALRRKRIVRE